MTALLEVRDLVKYYAAGGLFRGSAPPVRAVDGVSFEVGRGETLALVGESGCGKSSVGRTILRLQEPTGGQVTFEGNDVFALDRKSLRRLRRRMQIIFQDPYSSLNPRMSVGAAIAEGIEIHHLARGAEIGRRVGALLEEVGLDPGYARRYPHEFSGGQRQRIGIARALEVEPSFIVCDEPVSALDVSVQAAIINLLVDIQAKRGATLVFISHDLSVVRYLADYVAVMYLGQVMEFGRTEEVFSPPYHPYTEALLSAVPIADPDVQQRRIILEGAMPSPQNRPQGCPFATRCPRKVGAICDTTPPPTQTTGAGHRIFCHIPLDDLTKVDKVVVA